MSYKIGSFNLHNLGTSALGKENARDLKIIARIIKEENFDVIALQEILGEGKAFISPSYAKKCIINELGGDDLWGFEWADASNDDFVNPIQQADRSDPRGEGYAFVWNKKRLRLCSTNVLTRYGEVERIFYPRMLSTMKAEMFRKPYYGRFTAAGMLGGTNVEFRLVCVHTYYGKADNAASRAVRQNELDILLKDIYPQICDKRYGDPMAAYTIVLGDYNAEVWTDESREWQETLKASRGGKKPAIMMTDGNGIVTSQRYGGRKIKTVQTELTTLKSKITEKGSEEYDTEGYSFNYDHFSYEEDKFKDVGVKCQRVTKAVTKYCKIDAMDSYESNFEKYFKAVSDHIPIVMEINLV